MVELTHHSDRTLALDFAGDTFNTAVYLARRGLPVAYATALGDDIYSDRIVALGLCQLPDNAASGAR